MRDRENMKVRDMQGKRGENQDQSESIGANISYLPTDQCLRRYISLKKHTSRHFIIDSSCKLNLILYNSLITFSPKTAGYKH